MSNRPLKKFKRCPVAFNCHFHLQYALSGRECLLKKKSQHSNHQETAGQVCHSRCHRTKIITMFATFLCSKQGQARRKISATGDKRSTRHPDTVQPIFKHQIHDDSKSFPSGGWTYDREEHFVGNRKRGRSWKGWMDGSDFG